MRRKNKKLELTEYMLFFALALYTFMFCNSLSAQENRVGFDSDNENIYGEWVSMDGDHRLFLITLIMVILFIESHPKVL